MIQADTENRLIGSTDPANDRPGSGLMPTNTLDHEKVFNKGGEGRGTVRHSAPRAARPHCLRRAVFRRLSWHGDKLFAIPWAALQLDVDNKCFVLDVDKGMLTHTSGFDKDHRSTIADTSWAQQVHSHYTIPPYWH